MFALSACTSSEAHPTHTTASITPDARISTSGADANLPGSNDAPVEAVVANTRFAGVFWSSGGAGT
jgi:hypothetical protein